MVKPLLTNGAGLPRSLEMNGALVPEGGVARTTKLEANAESPHDAA